MIVHSIANGIPGWLRFAQCMRRYCDQDEKTWLPNLANAIKYSTILVAVFFATLTQLTIGENILDLVLEESNDHCFLFCFIVVAYDSSSSVFHPVWIVALIVSTVYMFVWDVKMDWGLFDGCCCGPGSDGDSWMWLRKQLAYSPYLYYGAIVQDLIVRFAWTLPVLLDQSGWMQADVLVTICAVVELTR